MSNYFSSGMFFSKKFGSSYAFFQKKTIVIFIENLLSSILSTVLHILLCVKSVPIRSLSDPYFPAFGMNTEKPLRILSECRKIRTRKTPNTDTFHTVYQRKGLFAKRTFSDHLVFWSSYVFLKTAFW